MNEEDKIRLEILEYIKKNDRKINHQDLTKNFLKRLSDVERENLVGKLSQDMYLKMWSSGNEHGYSVTERGLEKIKEYKSFRIKEIFRKDIPIIVSIIALLLSIFNTIASKIESNKVQKQIEQLNSKINDEHNTYPHSHQAVENAK